MKVKEILITKDHSSKCENIIGRLVISENVYNDIYAALVKESKEGVYKGVKLSFGGAFLIDKKEIIHLVLEGVEGR